MGVADDLETINGVSHAGQLIHLEANTTGTITLKHNTGNIFIPSEEDYTIEAGGFATLIYDIAIHANKWVLVSSSSSNVTGMTNPATADLDMNTFDIIDIDRLQFTSDSGTGRDNTKVEMYANANNDAVINFPDTKYFLWTQNGQYFLTADEDGLVPRLDDDWSIGTASYQLKDLQTKLWTADQGTIKQYLNMTNTGAGGDHYAYVVGQITSATNATASLGSSTVYLDDYDHYWLRTSTRILDLQSGETTAPTHAGEFRLDGTDVKVYTGGGVKSLSDIGSGGGSGANTELSNLTSSVAVNEDLDPTSDVSSSLGSASKRWNEIHGLNGVFGSMSMNGDIDMNNNEITDCGQLDVTQIDARGVATAIAFGDDIDLDALGKFIRFDDTTTSAVSGSASTVNGGGGMSCEAFLKIKIGSAVKYIPYFS